jgi:CIC family chloride channel protein
MNKNEFIHFLFIPLVIGILGALSAIGFRWLIDLFSNLYQTINIFHNNSFLLLIIPFLFWLSHFLITKLSINPSNVTLDNIAKKISILRGNFSILKGFLMLFLTSLNIGFGIPLGREAPIAKLGGLLGDILFKYAHINKVNLPIYLGASVSSAIAATFNAPLAGIILGLEIIIGKINTYIIIPMIVACATSTLLASEFLGNYRAFYVPHMQYSDKYLYIVPFEGILFAFITLGMFIFFDLFRELRVLLRHQWEKIIIFNGLIVAIFLYLVPQSKGVGYEYVTALFTSNSLNAEHIFLILIVKFIVVVISLSSGLFGGLMSPSIFIGAFGGYLFGDILFFNNIDPRIMALIGTVAMLGGMSRAPLRSSIIIVELTQSYQLLIPSLIAASISSFIVAKFEPGSYFRRSLVQKGIDLQNPKVMLFIQNIDFSKYFKYVKPIKDDVFVSKLFHIFRKRHIRYVPVVDNNNKLIGVVSVRDLRKRFFNKKHKLIKNIMSKKPIVFSESSSVNEIIKVLGLMNSTVVPYIDKNGKYIAMIDLNKLIKDIAMQDRYKII